MLKEKSIPLINHKLTLLIKKTLVCRSKQRERETHKVIKNYNILWRKRVECNSLAVAVYEALCCRKTLQTICLPDLVCNAEVCGLFEHCYLFINHALCSHARLIFFFHFLCYISVCETFVIGR